MRLLVALLLILSVLACSGGSGSADQVSQPDQARQDSVLPDQAVGDIGPVEIFEPDITTPEGYFEFCLQDPDCEPYGLKCISSEPADPEAFCSSECLTTAECPEGLACKKKGESSVCQKPSYCDKCLTDFQCTGGMKCLENDSGESFCSIPCAGESAISCPPGHTCRKHGSGLEDYFCFPMFGQCKGDGSHCSPCQVNDDCIRDHVCHINDQTKESYCAKICEIEADCPPDFGCFDSTTEGKKLCTAQVESNPIETCYLGKKEFCEPCAVGYECASDLCYALPEQSKYLCSFACDTSKWPKGGCPPGLFCVPNHGPSEGMACAPPPAWGCQGFLNCLGVECPTGEKCIDGFCQPK